MRYLLIKAALLSVCLLGCNTNDIQTVENEQSANTKKSNTVNQEKMLWQQGKVIYLDFEGGFYGIVTEAGDKYLPMSMPKEFLQNGAIIKFKGKIIKDMMTIRQWGQPFEINDIKLIKAGQRGNNQAIM